MWHNKLAGPILVAPGKDASLVDGTPPNVSIRATNILRRERGEWKMSAITDLLPFLRK